MRIFIYCYCLYTLGAAAAGMRDAILFLDRLNAFLGISGFEESCYGVVAASGGARRRIAHRSTRARRDIKDGESLSNVSREL